MDKEQLRIKNGRSKRCLDCKNHRCVITSCQCDCHKDIARSSVPRVFRHKNSKKAFKPKD